MKIKELEKNWNKFGESDPLWSILTNPKKTHNKWDKEEFFKTGEDEIGYLMEKINLMNIHFDKNKSLDFGCGVGRLTQALCKYFKKVEGVDIASSMIKLASSYNKHNNCNYIHNNKPNLKIYRDNTFDFVYSNLTLQHMKPRYSLGYIKEFSRILKPKGIMVFIIPSQNLFYNDFIKKLAFYIKKIKIKKNDNQTPVMEMYTIKKSTIVSLLKKNNIKILRIEFFQDKYYKYLLYIGTKEK